ncbi:hypothetical protein Bbelb_076830 [Branchiostoma belcheri]|nr:hypothetical protein Bbelb_076830 [Branchiostoma belcheri]
MAGNMLGSTEVLATKTCLLCNNAVKWRNYRTVFGDSMVPLYPQIHQVVKVWPDRQVWSRKGLSMYVCMFCVTKLNKLSKLENELSTRLQKLQQDKESLLMTLHGNMDSRNVATTSTTASTSSARPGNTPVQTTPTKVVRLKRSLVRTPTPKKLVKRPLLKTPVKKAPSPAAKALPCIPVPNIPVRQKHDKKTQFGPPPDKVGSVKVVVTYPSGQKTKFIRDQEDAKYLRALADGASAERLVGIIYRDPKYRPFLHRQVCHQLSRDCTGLCSDKDPSVLKKTDIDHLLNFNCETVINEWRQRAPLLYDVLQAVACSDQPKKHAEDKTEERHYPHIVQAGCALLYHRNRNMCGLQIATGMVLEKGGTTDEGMGVTVTPRTLYNKRKEMLNKHEEMMDRTVGDFVKQREYKASAEKYVSSSGHESKCAETASPVMSPSTSSVPVPQQAPDAWVPEKPLCRLPGDTGFSMPMSAPGYAIPTFPSSMYTSPSTPVQVQNSDGVDSSALRRPCGPATLTREVQVEGSATPMEVSMDGVVLTATTESHACNASWFPGSYGAAALTSPTISASSTTIAEEGRTMTIQKELLQKIHANPVTSIVALGDNFDLMKRPSMMTVEHQRESWHWFLVLLAKKRIFDYTLPNTSPKNNILTLETSSWLPLQQELEMYENNVDFHVARVLVKYIEFLKSYGACIPAYIDHPYVKESAQKSEIMNVELIDAPENSAEGIITIIKRLNKLLVPQTGGEDSTAVERIVLGGDVLTNERAFSGQAALMNADNERDSCAGIIHRPEGLHRLMNFLMGIYQEFYKEPVTGDRALPYSLRNIVNRRDVEGPKSHLAFVVDCVDAYTVAMACQHFGLSSIDGKPTANTPPVLHGTDKSGKYLWLLQQAKTIRKQLLSPGDHEQAMDIDHMTQQVAALDNRQQMLQTVQQEDGKYKCPHCGKEYVREKNFTKHQEKVHSIDLHVDTVPAEGQERKSEDTCSSSVSVISAFCRMGYLHRDTEDAYKMADGNRIFRNAKLEMLYACSLKHTKYTLWLWRMLAYEMALLNPSEAFDYKWNTCTNLQGGIGKNIPNDNAVELQVGEIKKRLHREGSNKTFQSAQTICKTTQIVNKVAENLRHVCGVDMKAAQRTVAKKEKDIETLVDEILQSKVLDSTTLYRTFHNYKDPMARLDMEKFFNWVKEQKEVSNMTMTRNARL